MTGKDNQERIISGRELSETFYWEAVRPILDDEFPDLPHAAALLGDGSEVLGFDDAMSTDHHWGPRVYIFLEENTYEHHAPAIQDLLSRKLPYEFRGYPTNFSTPDPDDNNVQLLEAIDSGSVNHRVGTYTIQSFIAEHLGIDIYEELEPADWLTISEQRLLVLTAGAVYHDTIGLESVLARFQYYPRDVWLYLLAADWARIGQEEHLMGRAGYAGDEVGSALIAARLVRDIMRLCFLMEQTYAPYAKWFGTAFKRLQCGDALWPTLQRILRAETWHVRGQHLATAYEHIAGMHNALGLTEALPEQVTSFHGRPFQVIAIHGFAESLLGQISDPAVRRIAGRPLIGSINQFSDSTDLVSNPIWRSALKQLYL